MAYAMTKGAIDIFTLNLAKLVGARGITVNSVAPGNTQTDINPNLKTKEVQQSVVSRTALGRFGVAPDIADVVAFFASDRVAGLLLKPSKPAEEIQYEQRE